MPFGERELAQPGADVAGAEDEKAQLGGLGETPG
jgi:hypothetical protein